MKKGFRYALFATAVLLFASCSATKYVPEGSYLLDEVRIQTDNREIKPSRPIDVCPPESECQMVQPDKDTVVCL